MQPNTAPNGPADQTPNNAPRPACVTPACYRSIIVVARRPRPSPTPRARRGRPRGDRWDVAGRPCCSEHADGRAPRSDGWDASAFDPDGEGGARFDAIELFSPPWHDGEADLMTGRVHLVGARMPTSVATGKAVSFDVAMEAWAESIHGGGLWNHEQERTVEKAPAARRRAIPRRFRRGCG